jgi:hypothetical protein
MRGKDDKPKQKFSQRTLNGKEYLRISANWNHVARKRDHYRIGIEIYLRILAPILTKLSISQQKYMGTSCFTFYPNWTNGATNMNKIPFSSLPKMYVSLHQFSRKILIVPRYNTPSLDQIGEEIWTVWHKIIYARK